MSVLMRLREMEDRCEELGNQEETEKEEGKNKQKGKKREEKKMEENFSTFKVIVTQK